MQRIADSIAEGAAHIAGFGAARAEIDDLASQQTFSSGGPTEPDTIERIDSAHPSSMTAVGIEISGLDDDEADFLDRTGLTTFAGRAAGVAAAVAEYGRQRDTALRLQRTLLPRSDLEAPGWEIVSHYGPGTFGLDVGGDWYDTSFDDDRIVCSVGDVSGTGVEAAAFMGQLRSQTRIEIGRGASIPALFDLLDRLCEQDDRMATMLVIEIPRAGGPARVWSAGHLPPVVVTDRASIVAPLAVVPPLGHGRGARAAATELDLPPDATVVMFTDGLVERRGEELTVSLDRLVETIDTSAPLHELVDRLVDEPDRADADDIAVLALRRCTSSVDPTVSPPLG